MATFFIKRVSHSYCSDCEELSYIKTETLLIERTNCEDNYRAMTRRVRELLCQQWRSWLRGQIIRTQLCIVRLTSVFQKRRFFQKRRSWMRGQTTIFRRTHTGRLRHSKTLSVLRYQALVICGDTPVLSYRHQTGRSLKNHELLATKKLCICYRVIHGLPFILLLSKNLDPATKSIQTLSFPFLCS